MKHLSRIFSLLLMLSVATALSLNAQVVRVQGGSVGSTTLNTGAGVTPAMQVTGSDALSPNGYGFFVAGNATSGGNMSMHTQISTGDAQSRMTLKCGDPTDFAPRLQMISGDDVTGSQGAALFDYGSRNYDASATAFFAMRFMPTAGAPVEMIRASSNEGVYLAHQAGMVGIGTSTPAELLHVAGTVRSDDLGGGGNVMADANGNLIISEIELQLSGNILSLSNGSSTIDLSTVIGGGGSSLWTDLGFNEIGYSTGNVAVGDITNPNHKLDVEDNSGAVAMRVVAVESDATATSADGEALNLRAGFKGLTMQNDLNPEELNGDTYGVDIDNFMSGSLFLGNNFSVFGYASGSRAGGHANYSIYGDEGQTAGNGTNYAGYFDGDVTVSGNLTELSDRKFKKNITGIGNALTLIKQLEPKEYEYRQNEFPHIGMKEGRRFGFIAQEMEQVVPSLVTYNIHPASTPPQGSDRPAGPSVEYKGINYTEMVPVLTKGIQEQQDIIEAQASEIELLKEENQELALKMEKIEMLLQELGLNDETNTQTAPSSTEDNRLFQNQPNPFNQATVIPYYLSPETNAATITIFDMKSGAQVKTFELTQKGSGKVTLDGGTLAAGAYTYTLVVDGKQVASKVMILTN